MPKLEKPDIQILIMGSSGVGKSCSMIRFTQDKFINNYIATQGIDFKNKKVTIGNKVINTRIWDTAGQERYKTVTTSYIRGADVIIVCYDITDMSSYNELYHWVKTAEYYSSITTPPLLIVGLKVDDIERRVVSYEDAYNNSKKLGGYYYEISGKTGENVEKMYTDAIKLALKIPLDTHISCVDNNGIISSSANNVVTDEKKKNKCIIS